MDEAAVELDFHTEAAALLAGSGVALPSGCGEDAIVASARTAEAADDALPVPLSVWLMDEPDCPAYERFIAAHPDAQAAHELAWRDRLIAGESGTPYFLAAMRGDEVVGALPLLLSPAATRRAHAELTACAELLADEDETRAALIAVARTLARSRDAEFNLAR